MYKRKTKDEFELQIDYGQGWEIATAESTRKEIIQRKKEYRENCAEYPTRIVKKRIKLEGQEK